MKAVKFDQVNKTYAAPEGMEDKCHDLHVHISKRIDNGNIVMVSKWELDEEDLKKINETKSLYLEILGQAHPVVAMYVESPFINILDLNECNTILDYQNRLGFVLNLMEDVANAKPYDECRYKQLDSEYNFITDKLIELNKQKEVL